MNNSFNIGHILVIISVTIEDEYTYIQKPMVVLKCEVYCWKI